MEMGISSNFVSLVNEAGTTRNNKRKQQIRNTLFIEDVLMAEELSDQDEPALVASLAEIDESLDIPRMDEDRFLKILGLLKPSRESTKESVVLNGIRLPDGTIEELFIEKQYSPLLGNLLSEQERIEGVLKRYEPYVWIRTCAGKHSLNEIPDLVNNDSKFLEAIEAANREMFRFRNQYASLSFGRRGFFSPFGIVEKVLEDGTFVYKKIVVESPEGSLTPSQIWHSSLGSNSHSTYARPLIQRIGGNGIYEQAEIAATFAMIGHYDGQLLTDCPFSGLYLFEEDDAQQIAAYVVKNIGERTNPDYSTVAAIGKLAIKCLASQGQHQELPYLAPESAYYLIDHLLVRLIDAGVLSATVGTSSQNIYFRIGEKYRLHSTERPETPSESLAIALNPAI